jgi:hypothetical protein
MSEVVIAKASQDIGDGGVWTKILEEPGYKGKKNYRLSFSLSHYGQAIQVSIPVFETTAEVLRAMADELDKIAVEDSAYLGRVGTTVFGSDGKEAYFQKVDGKVQEVDPPVYVSGCITAVEEDNS